VIEETGDDEKSLRSKKKQVLSRSEAIAKVRSTLEEMQNHLFQKALAFRAKHSRTIDSLDEFERFFKQEGGGFAWVHWSGTHEDEETMARRYQTTIRNIPFEGQGPDGSSGPGKCILTGRPSQKRVVMSEAY
jgi:prolyl-tRNA synthetase